MGWVLRTYRCKSLLPIHHFYPLTCPICSQHALSLLTAHGPLREPTEASRIAAVYIVLLLICGSVVVPQQPGFNAAIMLVTATEASNQSGASINFSVSHKSLYELMNYRTWKDMGNSVTLQSHDCNSFWRGMWTSSTSILHPLPFFPSSSYPSEFPAYTWHKQNYLTQNYYAWQDKGENKVWWCVKSVVFFFKGSFPSIN